MKELSLQDYIDGIKNQDRTILARAITLVESSLDSHKDMASELIREILPLCGKARRIGISGTPGVGKSTFLENFGMRLIDSGKKIAVLAIDPTSQITGGSILGDKTRMQNLSVSPNSFIRPTPNGKTLGGVASKTREAMLLCDAFGFDYIFIETVGVGQSEIAVASVVDFFVLLMQPGSGDELQGIKRGILEVSDLVIVNKADGKQLAISKMAKHDYEKSLSVLQEKRAWQTSVVLCSSTQRTGFDEIENQIQDYYKNFFKEEMRKSQLIKWVKELVLNHFSEKLEAYSELDNKIADIEQNQKSLYTVISEIYKDIK